MPTAKARVARDEDRYMQLIRAFPLRPIRSRQTHQEAKRLLRALAGEKGAAATDYRKVLVSLIAAYERDAGFRMNDKQMSAADVVRHLLDDREMSVNAFAKELGVAQSALSDMLNGKRDWSKSAIVAISSFFGLHPGIFLR